MYTSSIPAVSTPTEGDFRGKPVLTLPHPDDAAKPGFQFGTTKLRAFLANREAIEAFVAKHHKAKAADPRAAKLIAMLRSLGATDAEIAAATR